MKDKRIVYILLTLLLVSSLSPIVFNSFVKGDYTWKIVSKDYDINGAAIDETNSSTYTLNINTNTIDVHSYNVQVTSSYSDYNDRIEVNMWLEADGQVVDSNVSVPDIVMKDISNSILHTFNSGSLYDGIYQDYWSSPPDLEGLYSLYGTLTYNGEIYHGTGFFDSSSMQVHSKLDDINLDVNSSYTYIEAIKATTDTINWATVDAIKTKTDTIDWTDIDYIYTTSGQIKAKTDTIAWGDISAIKLKTDDIVWNDVTAIKAKTDTINWATVDAIKTKTDTIDWTDVDYIYTNLGIIKDKTDTINWADISAIKLKTDTLVWTDVTDIKNTTDLINWADVNAIKTSTDTIDWTDIDYIYTTSGQIKAKTDTIAWADIATIQASISGIGSVSLSSSDIEAIQAKVDLIDWAEVTAIRSRTDFIDWKDVIAIKRNTSPPESYIPESSGFGSTIYGFFSDVGDTITSFMATLFRESDLSSLSERDR